MSVRRDPDPAARIIVSKHAEFRLVERAPDLDQHAARDEIVEALLSRRFRHQGRCFWLAWTRHEERTYAFAVVDRGRSLVVMTVMTRELQPAAA